MKEPQIRVSEVWKIIRAYEHKAKLSEREEIAVMSDDMFRAFTDMRLPIPARAFETFAASIRARTEG